MGSTAVAINIPAFLPVSLYAAFCIVLAASLEMPLLALLDATVQ
jgi:hypothetical protein